MTPAMVGKARESAAEMGLDNVTIVEGSAEQLPFDDQAAD